MVDDIEETPVPEGEPPSEESPSLEATNDTEGAVDDEVPADEH